MYLIIFMFALFQAEKIESMDGQINNNLHQEQDCNVADSLGEQNEAIEAVAKKLAAIGDDLSSSYEVPHRGRVRIVKTIAMEILISFLKMAN